MCYDGFLSRCPAAENNAAVPVRVDFYGESLCPDCQHMVLDILQPMFDNGIAEFMHLRYIAYGNVRGSFDDDKGIQCQHGPVECQYNRYINCAQAKKPDQKEW
jgi:interferon, gamma-inducible protein 30